MIRPVKSATRRIVAFCAVAAAASSLPACGGGVPITVRIDSETIELNLDDAMGKAEEALKTQGILPPGLNALPEKWPAALPNFRYEIPIEPPPFSIDLTPEDPKEAAKYKDINETYRDVIQRIEFNRLVLRLEENTTNIPIPGLRVDLAEDPDADPEEEEVWEIIAEMKGAAPGEITDMEVEFIPGGPTFFNQQIMDPARDFALRAHGKFVYDTATSPYRPRGQATIRLIAVVTVFVEPPLSDITF